MLALLLFISLAWSPRASASPDYAILTTKADVILACDFLEPHEDYKEGVPYDGVPLTSEMEASAFCDPFGTEHGVSRALADFPVASQALVGVSAIADGFPGAAANAYAEVVYAFIIECSDPDVTCKEDSVDFSILFEVDGGLSGFGAHMVCVMLIYLGDFPPLEYQCVPDEPQIISAPIHYPLVDGKTDAIGVHWKIDGAAAMVFGYSSAVFVGRGSVVLPDGWKVTGAAIPESKSY